MCRKQGGSDSANTPGAETHGDSVSVPILRSAGAGSTQQEGGEEADADTDSPGANSPGSASGANPATDPPVLSALPGSSAPTSFEPAGVPSVEETTIRPRTRLQSGIRKPKVYTDGTI